MKVYDCFIFNDELGLLRLRLEYLQNSVDYFVIVESTRTLSGEPKPLHFADNKEKFAPFLPKIIHLVAPANDMPAWDYEYFQRNYIKEALQKCADEDIIVISDADEIVDLVDILSRPHLKLPVLAELTVYYYYFNLRSDKKFRVNLITPWSFIREKDIGNRNTLFPTYTDQVITTNPGWHFSYLYGKDVAAYQKKIAAFSHTEYNTPYYLDEKRIRGCVNAGVDLFERPYIHFRRNDASIQPILPLIKKLSLDHLLFKPGQRLQNGWFLWQKVYFRKLKNLFQQKNKG